MRSFAGARPSERGVAGVLFEGVEQGRGLQAVARRARSSLLAHAPRVDGLLYRRDDQAFVELCDAAVAKLDDLGEVVAGADFAALTS